MAEIDTAHWRAIFKSEPAEQSVKTLCDEIDRLRAEVHGRDVDLECRADSIDRLSEQLHKVGKERDVVRVHLASARADALEEAANEIEDFAPYWADRIRAIAEKTP